MKHSMNDMHIELNFVLTLSYIPSFYFSVYIEEIKEIRRGCNSKDFQRQPDLLKKIDPNCCFVIVYGNSFKLKTLSCLGE